MDVVRDTIRHNSWATCRLIEHLQSQSPEALLLSAPGTYWQIGATPFAYATATGHND